MNIVAHTQFDIIHMQLCPFPSPQLIKSSSGNEHHLLTLEPITAPGTVLNSTDLLTERPSLSQDLGGVRDGWGISWAGTLSLLWLQKRIYWLMIEKTRESRGGIGLMGQRRPATQVPLGLLLQFSFLTGCWPCSLLLTSYMLFNT